MKCAIRFRDGADDGVLGHATANNRVLGGRLRDTTASIAHRGVWEGNGVMGTCYSKYSCTRREMRPHYGELSSPHPTYTGILCGFVLSSATN